MDWGEGDFLVDVKNGGGDEIIPVEIQQGLDILMLISEFIQISLLCSHY